MSCHASDETLELYARDKCPEEKLPELEEHLLVCAQCQDRLTETEQYMGAMCAAARDLQAAERQRALPGRIKGWRPLAVAFTGVAAALVIGVIAIPRWPVRTSTPQEVVLTAHRGNPAASATAHAQRPLDLVLDVSDLAPGAYRVQVAGRRGEELHAAGVRTGQGVIRWRAPGLPAGQYWIRVYTPDGALLREFALPVR